MGPKSVPPDRGGVTTSLPWRGSTAVSGLTVKSPRRILEEGGDGGDSGLREERRVDGVTRAVVSQSDSTPWSHPVGEYKGGEGGGRE